MTARRRPEATGRREDLLEATRRVVVREGVAATTTRRIATEAGVPLGTVHYWFASKDELLEALALDHVGRIGAAALEAMQAPGATDAGAGLHAALARELAYPQPEQLMLYELATWALRTPGRAELAARLYTAIREATAQACAPWLERHGPALGADPEVVATLVAALFDGLQLARLADPEGTRAGEVLTVFGRLLECAAAAPDGAPDALRE